MHHYGKPIVARYIFDAYAAASYYTSHLTKIDKSITNECWTIIKKCEDENIDVDLKIKKLGNAFINAQQMSTQLTTYIILSLPLYHAFRSISFLNTSLQLQHTFVFKSIKLLNELPPKLCWHQSIITDW